MRHFLNFRGLASGTIATCKSALGRPLMYGFNIDISSKSFLDFIKTLQFLRLAHPSWLISRLLERVLNLCLFNMFSLNLSLLDLTMKCVFLMTMTTGGWVSEIHALLWDDFLPFSEDSVTLFLNPNYWAKNEHPTVRRDPIVNTEAGGFWESHSPSVSSGGF